jgi:molybdenum cofactor biosynthesis protein B
MTKFSDVILPSSQQAIQIGLVSISNRYTLATDDTGSAFERAIAAQGHQLCQRLIVKEDLYQIRAAISQLIANTQCQVILLLGGTGFHAKNCTIEAISVLFDREIPGFGELFRQLSFAQIGSAAMQSSACAGLANNTLIFALPGSPAAAALAANKLIWPQLQAQTEPCNFTHLLHQQYNKMNCNSPQINN